MLSLKVHQLIVLGIFSLYNIDLNIKPDIIAIPRITNKNAAIILFLKIDFKRITSVKLAPALPIIKAITAPSPIPFVTSAALRGITASALI